MKIKRIISILVLVCFFTTQVLIKPKDAEAVAPIVPIAVDLAVGMLVSAGITAASNAYLEHIARNELNKLTPEQLAELSPEGKISELTVDEFLRHGYKYPKKQPKKIIKLKGGIGKTALISALISGVLTGGSYAINYISSKRVDNIEGIEEHIIYNEYSGYNEDFEVIYSSDTIKDGKYYSIASNNCSIGITHNDPFNNTFFYLNNGEARIEKYYGRVVYEGNGNSIAVHSTRDNQNRRILRYYVDNEVVKTEIYVNGLRIAVAVGGAYHILGDYDIEINNYQYTGTINPVIVSNPSTENNKRKLNNVNERDDKYIIVIEHTDGSYSLETGTEIETGTGVQYIPDPSDTDPVVPNDPTEGDKPDLSKLYGVITTRWPFSLPWDIAYLLNIVFADPVPPKWTFTLPENFGSHEFTVDMTQLEGFMPVVRWFITFAFCFGIVLAIRKLYGGSV